MLLIHNWKGQGNKIEESDELNDYRALIKDFEIIKKNICHLITNMCTVRQVS